MIIDNLDIYGLGPLTFINLNVNRLTILTGENDTGKTLSLKLFEILKDIGKLNNNDILELVNKINLLKSDEDYKSKYESFKNALTSYLENDLSKDFVWDGEAFQELLFFISKDIVCSHIQKKLELLTYNNHNFDFNDLNHYYSHLNFLFNGNFFLNDGGKLRFLKSNITTEGESIDNTLLKEEDIFLTFSIDSNELKLKIDIKHYLNNAKKNTVIVEILCDIIRVLWSYYTDPAVVFDEHDYRILNDNIKLFKPQKSIFYKIASDLEKELFTIRLDKTYNVKSKSYEKLYGLINTLKYTLDKDSVFIIDDIEEYLHPKTQLIVIKHLIHAVNHGLKLIIVTNSEFVLNKINNSILLNKCDDDWLNNNGYTKYDCLNHSEVSLYSFSRIEEPTIDGNRIWVNEDGFCETSIDYLLNELYEEQKLLKSI